MTDNTLVWLPAAIAAFSAIAVAFIGYITTRNQKKQTEMIKAMEENTEFRAEIRQKESRLSMEMMNANCKLGIVTAKAVKGEKTNGDMEEARRMAEEASRNYESFLMSATSKLVSS